MSILDHDSLIQLSARMNALEKAMLQQQFHVNTLATSVDDNTKALSEYIELSKHFKFTLKVLGWIERICVWVAKVATALAIMWGVWKFIITQAITSSLSK